MCDNVYEPSFQTIARVAFAILNLRTLIDFDDCNNANGLHSSLVRSQLRSKSNASSSSSPPLCSSLK